MTGATVLCSNTPGSKTRVRRPYSTCDPTHGETTLPLAVVYQPGQPVVNVVF